MHDEFLSWPDMEQDKALAWLLHKRELCPGCGFPLDETTDDAHRHEWEEQPLWCNACERRESARQIESQATSDTSGRLWTVVRRSEVSSAP